MKSSVVCLLLLASAACAAPQTETRTKLIEASRTGSYTVRSVRVKESADEGANLNRPDARSSISICYQYGLCTVEINTYSTTTYFEGDVRSICDVYETPYYDPYIDCFCCIVL